MGIGMLACVFHSWSIRAFKPAFRSRHAPFGRRRSLALLLLTGNELKRPSVMGLICSSVSGQTGNRHCWATRTIVRGGQWAGGGELLLLSLLSLSGRRRSAAADPDEDAVHLCGCCRWRGLGRRGEECRSRRLAVRRLSLFNRCTLRPRHIWPSQEDHSRDTILNRSGS